MHKSAEQMDLKDSKTKLMTLQNELPIKGEFSAIVRNQTCGIQSRFLVVKGIINSPPLISKSTLTELGMLQIRDDGSFAEPNSLRIPGKETHINAISKDFIQNKKYPDNCIKTQKILKEKAESETIRTAKSYL